METIVLLDLIIRHHAWYDFESFFWDIFLTEIDLHQKESPDLGGKRTSYYSNLLPPMKNIIEQSNFACADDFVAREQFVDGIHPWKGLFHGSLLFSWITACIRRPCHPSHSQKSMTGALIPWIKA